MSNSQEDANGDAKPEIDEVRKFWNSVWGKQITHKTSAQWIKEEKKKTNKIPCMATQNISKEDIQHAHNA